MQGVLRAGEKVPCCKKVKVWGNEPHTFFSSYRKFHILYNRPLEKTRYLGLLLHLCLRLLTMACLTYIVLNMAIIKMAAAIKSHFIIFCLPALFCSSASFSASPSSFSFISSIFAECFSIYASLSAALAWPTGFDS